jgi:hypothetical protein
LVPFGSPLGLEAVTTRQEVGPGFTEEVRDDDNERSLDCDEGWFELVRNGQRIITFVWSAREHTW